MVLWFSPQEGSAKRSESTSADGCPFLCPAPNERMQLNCGVVIDSKGFNTASPRYAWCQSSLSSIGKVETFVTDHTQIITILPQPSEAMNGWSKGIKVPKGDCRPY
eukprot:1143288-Pelagomonas_calceolata.AAC.4